MRCDAPSGIHFFLALLLAFHMSCKKCIQCNVSEWAFVVKKNVTHEYIILYLILQVCQRQQWHKYDKDVPLLFLALLLYLRDSKHIFRMQYNDEILLKFKLTYNLCDKIHVPHLQFCLYFKRANKLFCLSFVYFLSFLFLPHTQTHQPTNHPHHTLNTIKVKRLRMQELLLSLFYTSRIDTLDFCNFSNILRSCAFIQMPIDFIE